MYVVRAACVCARCRACECVCMRARSVCMCTRALLRVHYVRVSVCVCVSRQYTALFYGFGAYADINMAGSPAPAPRRKDYGGTPGGYRTGFFLANVKNRATYTYLPTSTTLPM
uniref:Uncharacterized protein n=1 Tax=Schizaphis graminum TaxID=13262 RepID=A0A2S2PBB2_SCHGA